MKHLLPFLLLGTACLGDASPGSAIDDTTPDDGANTSDGGPDTQVANVLYFSAMYFVPERSEASTYSVDEAEWVVRKDTLTLAYSLPRLLVGSTQRVAFAGPVPQRGELAELVGPRGIAHCTLAADNSPITCQEEFADIEVDLARVRELASAIDPLRVDARVLVSTLFVNDPIGVLELRDILLGPVQLRSCQNSGSCNGQECDIELEDQVGFCEPEAGEREAGADCALSVECSEDFECDFEDGNGTCQPHGGDD